MGTVPNKGVAFGGMEMSVNDDDGQLITPTGEHNMHATFLNEYKQMRLEAMAATVIQVISLLLILTNDLQITRWNLSKILYTFNLNQKFACYYCTNQSLNMYLP